MELEVWHDPRRRLVKNEPVMPPRALSRGFKLVSSTIEETDWSFRMANGECNCGIVGFEITAELSDVFVCHCSICRRATGSNGIAVVVIENADFRWLRGKELVTS